MNWQPQQFGHMSGIENSHLTGNCNFGGSPSPATMDNQQNAFQSTLSHNSSAASLVNDGSQFPIYQLLNFTDQESAVDANMLPFPQYLDDDCSPAGNQVGNAGNDTAALFESDDPPSVPHVSSVGYLPNAQGNHSQPIDIHTQGLSAPSNASSTAEYVFFNPHVPQSDSAVNLMTLAPQRNTQPTTASGFSAPLSDFRRECPQYGNASGFGSALSSPGLAPFQRQRKIFYNHSVDNFNVPSQQPSLSMEMIQQQSGNALGSGHSLATLQTTKKFAACSIQSDSPGYWNSPSDPNPVFQFPNASGNDLFNDVSISGDDCCNDVFGSSDHSDSPFPNYSSPQSFNQRNVTLLSEPNTVLPNSDYQQFEPQGLHSIPPRQSMNSSSSYAGSYPSPQNVKQEAGEFNAMDPDAMCLMTDQEKADLRRIRNNEACRRSRKKRKQEKEETAAKVAQLTDENSRLKEKIICLESHVKAMKGDVKRRMSHS